jgi:hypothetical protein
METKNLFVSKTFWVNVLLAAATYGQYLPPKYAPAVVLVANTILRLVTNTAATVL